jgi:hypothetical protein
LLDETVASAALDVPKTLTGTEEKPFAVTATTTCCPVVKVRDCPGFTVNVRTWYVLVGVVPAVSPTRVAAVKSPR